MHIEKLGYLCPVVKSKCQSKFNFVFKESNMPYVGLSDIQRGRIVALVEQGMSQRQIAATVGVSQGVVSKTYARFLELETLKNRPRQSRRRVTSDRQDRFLIQIAKRNPTSTHRDLQRQLLQATGVGVSVETIRKRLRAGNLFSRRQLRVPELSRQNKTDRLNWCLEHQNWTIEDWQNVLFSDETRIGLRSDDRRIRVLRGRGRQARLQTARSVPRYKGGTVMFWGGIMMGEKTPLRPLRQSVTGRRYVDLVLEPIVRLWRGAMGNIFIFMHDNAPPHSSRVATEFLETEDVTVLRWPACSPDINPIEHVWDFIKRRIRARRNAPGNVDQLIEAALEEWANLPQEQVDNLIRSIPRRIEDCIGARGGNTNY